MPEGRLSTWWILQLVIALSIMLNVFVLAVKDSLKVRHQEFQELVLISGVLDTLERERTGNFQVRLAFQGDEYLYMIKDDVYPALDWENFSAKESVGSRVSLTVERAQLTQARQKWRTIHVYGLESSRGIYLAPEDSLKELRDEVYLILIIAVVIVLCFLWVLRIFVSSIWYPSSYWGRYARSESFRRREDRMREGS